MGRVSGTKLQRGRKRRNLDILLLEQAVLNGERIDSGRLMRMPQADLLASPLLGKVFGESTIWSGRLREGVAWLSQDLCASF